MFYRLVRQISVDTKIGMTSLQLYKYLLRQCEKLPPDACKHYKFAIKQSYKQHKSESDPERVKEIIHKSICDAKWIVNKYLKK
ncbi:LYR motif-containing protein 9 isoform X2 [Maniola jurtina]|uniref:LYR motif-containing protein 9 isoform X2 n=1 Tax=Maniola jurtina TaxID=191418 RepID=UPI001E68F31B|nr:LYR motif-containing protein 9 isoform X2 [Maniola jurtina]